MKPTMRRAITAGTVLVLAGTAAVGAFATVITPTTPRNGSLVSFGPLMDNGFPTSYKDSKAVRLEACFTADDPFCPAPPGSFDPTQPVSFPTNFPDEFFYQLASAVVPANPADATEKLLVETDLEGAFATGPPIPGDQMVFARIRIKDVDVPAGVTWRITHPYGIDEFTAGANGKPGINVTQDVGTVPGVFSGALASRVGPFLAWDPADAPAAPAGHIGDPGVLHTVIGSPYGTNFIKVERKNADGSYTTIGQWDDQFSLQGRYAVNSGVDVDAAYFTGNDSGGSLDVYASSDAGQSIQIKANAALGTPTILMREQDGRYYARIDVARKVPAGTKITVVNAGDKPPAPKTAALADLVTIGSATYDADTKDLTITATSSDTESGADAPVLTVPGFGPLVNGTATFPAVTAPPAVVRVASSAGGSDTSTLKVTGAGFPALAPTAQFALPATVQVGQPVDLDGLASTGDITSYAWTTSNGTISPTTLGRASWTPATSGAATVTLTVTGPGGTSAVSHGSTVLPPAGVVASAGPDQTQTRGQVVTLDASGTIGQRSMVWSQLSGPPVTLSSTTAANPTFRYPLMALPVGPAGHLNAGYAVANQPVVLQLTATASTGTGTATDTVTISPTVENLGALTARYRTRGEWRLTGTSSLAAAQTVAMVLGSDPATGAYIGQASVDAAGAFSFKGGAQPVAGGSTVTFVSSTGGSAVGTLLITP